MKAKETIETKETIEFPVKRYQDCNKITKLFRRRWMLFVPFYAIHLWFHINLNKKRRKDIPELRYFKNCYHIAIGTYQCKMKYYYTTEEAFGKLKEKYNFDLEKSDDDIDVDNCGNDEFYNVDIDDI